MTSSISNSAASTSKLFSQDAPGLRTSREDPTDPFDALLTLETTYETSGYTDGLRDGQSQARISARLFGIEKAAERWEILGRLWYRAVRWAGEYGVELETGPKVDTEDSQLGPNPSDQVQSAPTVSSFEDVPKPRAGLLASSGMQSQRVERVRRHIAILLRLTDPATLSSTNNDEAIGDFDERMKRATAKARVIERMLRIERDGTEAGGTGSEGGGLIEGDGDIENPRLNIAALGLKKGVESESLGKEIE